MSDTAQIIEREERYRFAAALCSLAGVVLIIASIALLSAGLPSTDTDAELLSAIDGHSGTALASYLMKGLGFLVFAVPLAYLFRAADARSEGMRGGLIGVTVLGPVLLAGSAVVTYLFIRDAASDFVNIAATAKHPNAQATDLLEQGTLHDLAGGLGFGGAIGLAAGTLYSCLYGMRTGLLTRFWGSLGMAAGVVSLFLPFFLMAWFIYFGLLCWGWVPGGRPPAWAAGEAIPWPDPRGQLDEEPEAEEGAAPPAIEGTATESTESEQGGASTQGPRRKKRKRRR